MPAIDVHGVSINYEDMGGPSPPIVLVHGFASSLEGNWRRAGWFDALAAVGRRVIALDCRGHGQSAKPHDPEAYKGSTMAEDVIAVMDAAGVESADLMGYSMGGAISIDLMVRHPKRLKTVTLGGAGLRGAQELAARQQATRIDPANMDEAARQRYTQRGNDLEALAAVRRGRSYRRDEDAIRRFESPLLMVVGERDGALTGAKRLCGLVPHAELVVVPGADHLSCVGRPEYKDAVLAFLAKHSPVVA